VKKMVVLLLVEIGIMRYLSNNQIIRCARFSFGDFMANSTSEA